MGYEAASSYNRRPRSSSYNSFTQDDSAPGGVAYFPNPAPTLIAQISCPHHEMPMRLLVMEKSGRRDHTSRVNIARLHSRTQAWFTERLQ